MNLGYTNHWVPVENTVYERLVDNSLLHTLTLDKKILKQTKILNSKLKRRRNLREYKQFVFFKRKSVEEFKDSQAETDDESGLDHESYKKIHTEISRRQLRTFLKSCVRKPPSHTKKKSPQVTSKLRNKSSSHSKSSRSRSAAEVRSYSGENICKYLLPSRRKVPTIECKAESPSQEIISFPINSNINEDNVQTGDDALKKVEDNKATSLQIGTVDSIRLDSKCELPVIYDNTAVNSLKFNNNSHKSDNREPDKHEMNTTVEDNVKTSRTASKCLNNSKMGISALPVDTFAMNGEKIKENIDVNLKSDIDKPADNLDRDSGNNSFSDTDVLDDQYRIRPKNSIPEDGCNDGTTTDEEISNKTQEKIVTIKPDEATNAAILCEDLNTSQSELQCEIPFKNEKLPDSNLDNETSLGLGLSENQDENLKDEFHIESIPKNGRNKSKILAIDHYKKGYESFNECHSRKLTKLRTISDSDCAISKHVNKFVETVSPSEYEEPLNSLVDTEDCSNILTSTRQNVNKFRESQLISADEDQSQSDAFSERCASSEIQSQRLNRSLNNSISSCFNRSYDEDVKNTVKQQLLSEIKNRLMDNQHNVKNKSVSPSEELFSASSQRRKNINESTNEPFKTRNAQSSNADDSVKEYNSLKVISQNTNKRSVLGEGLLSSKSKRAKRRIVNSDTDHNLSVNSSCASKQPRQCTNEQYGIIPHEHETPGDSSNQLQSDKSKEIAHSTKKRHRPRNLQEFADIEAVEQDTTKAYFRLKDISDDDEIWIMDVPNMINPKDLESQTILLGGKSVLKFGDDCYKVSSKPSKGVCNLSCVLTTSKRKNDYKILNIRSKGHMKFRQKISVMSDSNLVPSELPSPKTAVPFPKNLKIRHPLFGATYEDKT
ncbi:uncharacterized protein LOC124416478 [Diprion similis]|uniref:uncharacterized protein LOC124416478 n=1 Tax=Diprion similis TaxID=362088 RepID=UPI001EF7D6FF|nr:uncharacterized protein LOC124416478 [Diprion similis]